MCRRAHRARMASLRALRRPVLSIHVPRCQVPENEKSWRQRGIQAWLSILASPGPTETSTSQLSLASAPFHSRETICEWVGGSAHFGLGLATRQMRAASCAWVG